MQPLPDLINGIKILEPFLNSYGFVLNEYKNGKGSGGQFTTADFVKENKKIVIGYRYSVGQLGYQYNNDIVSHPFYLDYLGHKGEKLFPGFQSDDKLIAFKHILHDFEFLKDDFFEGSCLKLIEASIELKNIITQRSAEAQVEHDNYFDNIKIEKARKLFKEKLYREASKAYKRVENKSLLTDYDDKLMAYCKKHSWKFW